LELEGLLYLNSTEFTISLLFLNKQSLVAG